MTKKSKRQVSAVAQVEASWDSEGQFSIDVPTVSLYGDAVSVTGLEAREQIMVWMRLLEEIEEKICNLELDSGLDRDDVVNVLWWRLETIDADEEDGVAR